MTRPPLTLTLTRDDGSYASAAVEADPSVYGHDPLADPDYLLDVVRNLREALLKMPRRSRRDQR